ncbi:ComF family protein [Candidatus Saccharibacteria bacterium]|nr:ComF family protein [Candidatus Saccharibacteria bacterium]
MGVFETAIGWLAPPQCIGCDIEGTALCEACSTSEIVAYGERCYLCGAVAPGGRTCPSCRPGSPRFVWISTNYEGPAKDLVKLYKFRHQRAAASTLAQLMNQTMLDFNTKADVARTDYLVVPVPTATSRIRQRSFDHSTLLARALAKKLGLKEAAVLGRLGQSRQLGAPRSTRLKQADGQYYVRLPHLVKGRNILLIDDVVTTGATIKAVTKQLRRAGARRIDALVFAKRL